MKKFAVIGLGRFGARIATTLAEKGAQVIGIDNKEDRIEDIKDKIALAIKMEAIDEDSLKEQGIDEVDVAIVTIGEDFESNILSTVSLKRIKVPYIISRAATEIQMEVLKRIGADRVVFPEDEMGSKLADGLVRPTLLDNIPLSKGHSVAQIEAPKAFLGKKISQLKFREKYHVNVVAIVRKEVQKDEQGNEYYDEKVNDIPGPEDVINKGDTLIVVGGDADIASVLKC